MGTFTAQVLVGDAHPNDGGIMPSHFLFLSENSMPSWVLVSENVFSESRREKVVWIPTVGNMLEDALVMIAIHVLANDQILQLAETRNLASMNRVEVWEWPDEYRRRLYDVTRQVLSGCKLVVTAFENSTILGQLGVLAKYAVDVEVCTTTYIREHSMWRSDVRESGSLPSLK